MAAEPLAGVRVLVTRPAAQAGRLCGLIETAGGEAIRFPVLEIAPPADPEAARAVVARLGEFNLAVFVSANAVDWLRRFMAGRAWPRGLRAAAVGRRTAEALETLGVGEVIVPASGFDSEALLAEPAFADVAGRRVLIVRGEGGREWLRQALEARGARVEYAELYRRGRPQADPGPLLDRWEAGGVDAVTVASGESLDNLFAMLGGRGRPLIAGTPLMVPGPRVAAHATELGVEEIHTAADATDEAMLRALEAWAADRARPDA
ncbi:MAG TPA: uroporphyrinogen-III synthase [Thiotrichales bacterium]|nr:uroporphyrinogen-III synthase [Thiotrichales bacterium]